MTDHALNIAFILGVVAWTWGGGWLSSFLGVGFTDFAGSAVVWLWQQWVGRSSGADEPESSNQSMHVRSGQISCRCWGHVSIPVFSAWTDPHSRGRNILRGVDD